MNYLFSEPTIVYTPTTEEEQYNYLQQELNWSIEQENYEKCIEIQEKMKKFAYFNNTDNRYDK